MQYKYNSLTGVLIQTDNRSDMEHFKVDNADQVVNMNKNRGVNKKITKCFRFHYKENEGCCFRSERGNMYVKG